MAYELATQVEKDGIEHNITVVEIRGKPCTLASGQCAGFITSRGIQELDVHNNRGPIWTPLFAEAQMR